MRQMNEQKIIQALKNAGDYFARQYEALITSQYEIIENLPEAVREEKRRTIAEVDTALREKGSSLLLLHAKMAQELAAIIKTGTTCMGVPWRDSNDVANMASNIILSLAVIDNKNPLLQEFKDLDQETGLRWVEFSRQKWQQAPHLYKRSDVECDTLSFDMPKETLAVNLLAIIEDDPPQKIQQKRTDSVVRLNRTN